MPFNPIRQVGTNRTHSVLGWDVGAGVLTLTDCQRNDLIRCLGADADLKRLVFAVTGLHLLD